MCPQAHQHGSGGSWRMFLLCPEIYVISHFYFIPLRLLFSRNSRPGDKTVGLCELPVRPSVWASLLKRPPLTVRICILYFFPGVRSSNLCCLVKAGFDVLLRRIPFSFRSRISYLSATPMAFCQLTTKEWLLYTLSAVIPWTDAGTAGKEKKQVPSSAVE